MQILVKLMQTTCRVTNKGFVSGDDRYLENAKGPPVAYAVIIVALLKARVFVFLLVAASNVGLRRGSLDMIEHTEYSVLFSIVASCY